MKKSILVTKPHLPPLHEFLPYLEEIWNTHILTNNGPFHEKFEDELCSYLGVSNISLFNNGTSALITAIQALGLSGEVITTPFSFVATTHSLWWNGIKPVFVDILPDTYNLDPAKIEAAITDETSAILPVHCYGSPCDVRAIKEIADKYNLKVLYDAAHAFGVLSGGSGLLAAGDMSVLSFHATKVFNTFEGGAIISPDKRTKELVDRLKNFGITDEVSIEGPGSNGKMNEICSAMGLLQLKYVDKAIRKRKKIDNLYREMLQEVPYISLIKRQKDVTYNYAYFPILIDSKYSMTRDEIYYKLKEDEIYPRRYFYPLISDFEMYKKLPSAQKSNLPIASKISSQILCLPLYPDLEEQDIERIVNILKNPTKSVN